MIFLNSLLGKDRGGFPFMTQGGLRGKLKGNLRGILLWLCALQTPTKLKTRNHSRATAHSYNQFYMNALIR